MLIHKNHHYTLRESLTERVLQFGTGVLLRGLIDDIIDKANKASIYDGSIIVVKTTGPNLSEFTNQDAYYTLIESGIKNSKDHYKISVIESISRVLSSVSHWSEILETASNPNINLVISNTTEVGIAYQKEENLLKNVPVSYPGKLTAWLYKRYTTIKTPTFIIPTELLVDNGKILKDIVLKQVQDHNLGADFTAWLNANVRFCSSLVDRIVTGKPNDTELKQLWENLGYEDHLLIKSEPYALWAIEGENLEKHLGFLKDPELGVVASKNIDKYRELKLRLLNGTHSLMCALSFLSGFQFVKDTLSDHFYSKFTENLMLTELGPAINLPALDEKVKVRYVMEVLDRFKNQTIDHKWHNISLQYSLKMKTRVVPLLVNYLKTYKTVPHYLSRAIAAFLLFMKAEKAENNTFYGTYEGVKYDINCDHASYFYELWQNHNTPEALVSATFNDAGFWGTDALANETEFKNSVASHLSNMKMFGVKDALVSLNVFE